MLATAGLAGCTQGGLNGITGAGGSDGGGGTDTPGNATATNETAAGTPGQSSLHSGPTIPSYPTAPASASSIDSVEPSTAIPVLTADDVTDYGDVEYVADPFLFVEDGQWHLFFEVYNTKKTPEAVIGHATSDDGLDWTYQGVVLTKAHHTSFPLTWKWKGDYYMCPPTGKDVELWRAKQFPTDWEFLGNVIEVDWYPHDPVYVHYNDKWWMFTDRKSEEVMIYYNDELKADGWKPHAKNPVVKNRLQAAHHAGRPIVWGDRLLVSYMDNVAHYGNQVRLYEVTDLTPNSYADKELPNSPILHPFGDGWASEGLHTFDPWWRGPKKGWRCSVDGQKDDIWTIAILDILP